MPKGGPLFTLRPIVLQLLSLQMASDTQKLSFYIPETMTDWPWERQMNPHYEEAKVASDAWLKSLKPFSKASQRAFDKCNNGESFQVRPQKFTFIAD